MMKKIVFILILCLPVFVFSQEISSMNKVETIRFINQIIKPKGNTGSISSIGSKVDYSENYYDKGAIMHTKFNLASVSIIKLSNGVKISCRSGSCMEYNYKDREKEETKKIKSLTLESETPGDLYSAFLRLKKSVGL